MASNSKSPRRIVVVGGSIAGVRAAEQFRRRGYDGDLAIVCKEPHFPPYDRPPLSKEVLSGRWELSEARLRMYEDVRADVRLGTAATGLDVARQEVRLEGDAILPYDLLVIATGATVRRLKTPGAELGGVHYLRSAEDCLQILEEMASTSRVTVVGAGFIGAEVASAFRERGVSVTLVDVSRCPLVDVVGEVAATYLVDQHIAHGTRLKLGVAVSKIVGSGRVQSVQLTDGTSIETDLLVVGVGVVPETAWLGTSELVLDDGVVCDSFCMPVGARSIAVAGDAARWYSARYGLMMRNEHWSSAVEQAEYVADVLLDGHENHGPFMGVPYFWSEQYGRLTQFVGVIGPRAEVSEGSLDAQKCVITYTRMGRLVGALCINWPARVPKYRKLLADANPR